MGSERHVRIELVYALPATQDVLELKLAEGVTAKCALERSGLLERHPEIAEEAVSFGIHGRTVAADTILRDGDRVEIYRPLRADPKLARRRRAARAR